MSELEIRVEGARPLADRLLSFRTGSVLVETADTITPGLVVALKLAAPRKTGRLAERIRAQRKTTLGQGAKVDVLATTDVPYAGFVLHGTHGPYLISPKNKQALHWVDSGGADVFATSVTHPGIKANPFPIRVWEGLRSIVVAEMVERVRLRLTE